jgi:hypothetical protein
MVAIMNFKLLFNDKIIGLVLQKSLNTVEPIRLVVHGL